MHACLLACETAPGLSPPRGRAHLAGSVGRETPPPRLLHACPCSRPLVPIPSWPLGSKLPEGRALEWGTLEPPLPCLAQTS